MSLQQGKKHNLDKYPPIHMHTGLRNTSAVLRCCIPGMSSGMYCQRDTAWPEMGRMTSSRTTAKVMSLLWGQACLPVAQPCLRLILRLATCCAAANAQQMCHNTRAGDDNIVISIQVNLDNPGCVML